MRVPRSVADVLRNHVVPEVESIGRTYLNVYVPQLQAVEGVLRFIRLHRGHKVASTLLVEPIVKSTALVNHYFYCLDRDCGLFFLTLHSRASRGRHAA